jgi:hypothetical protein
MRSAVLTGELLTRMAIFFLVAAVPTVGLCDPLDAIAAYDGTWHMRIVTKDSAFSKAATEETTLRNACWRNGQYFACNQYVNGESKILIVFTYDQKRGQFTSYQVPADGSPAGSGVLEIQGREWQYPWDETIDGETVHFRVVNVFEGRTHIFYRREFSTDGTTWTIMATGSETKSPDRQPKSTP